MAKIQTQPGTFSTLANYIKRLFHIKIPDYSHEKRETGITMAAYLKIKIRLKLILIKIKVTNEILIKIDFNVNCN